MSHWRLMVGRPVRIGETVLELGVDYVIDHGQVVIMGSARAVEAFKILCRKKATDGARSDSRATL